MTNRKKLLLTGVFFWVIGILVMSFDIPRVAAEGGISLLGEQEAATVVVGFWCDECDIAGVGCTSTTALQMLEFGAGVSR